MMRKSSDTGRARKALHAIREFARFLASEMKPKGKIWTPFNVITGTIIVVGIALIAIRFYLGLGAVTNLSQDYPWGILKGFNLFAGVAFAGGAYVLTFVVHIMKFEKYEPIVRVTVLNGFLAYLFYAGALFLESTFPHKIFRDKIGNTLRASHDDILLGLAKGCIGALFAYLFLKVIELVHGGHWGLLATPLGYWYLVEVVGFVVFPIFLYGAGVPRRSVRLVQFASFFTALGG